MVDKSSKRNGRERWRKGKMVRKDEVEEEPLKGEVKSSVNLLNSEDPIVYFMGVAGRSSCVSGRK